MKTRNYIVAGLWLATRAFSAEDLEPCWLTSAQARQVEKVVQLKKAGAEEYASMGMGETMQGQDLMRTGSEGSMVELQFDNGSVARLGSETAFTFGTNRSGLELDKGIALFSAKEGCKVGCETCGLTIVQRSTGIVEQFRVKGTDGKGSRCVTKYILLEGSATVSKRGGGLTRKLRGGQMILQFADAELAQVQEVDIRRLVRESRIINGFKNPLPSLARIQEVVDRQQREIGRGTLEASGLIIGGRGRERFFQPAILAAGLEAPFDPDVGGAIVKGSVSGCPTCP